MRSIGTLLVVDDDRDIRDLISRSFERAGFAICGAGSGEEALEFARRELPRAVMLDVNLPDISGYEVCRSLRDDYGDEMAIVFVSGMRTESYDRVAGLLIGADDYVTKPFAPDELVERVRRLVRRLAPTARLLATRLTNRELQVLRLLATGMSQDDIAMHLVISPKTVATHIEHIFLKLGVRSRAQAVALAYRDDLMAFRSGGGEVPRSDPSSAGLRQLSPETGVIEPRRAASLQPVSSLPRSVFPMVKISTSS